MIGIGTQGAIGSSIAGFAMIPSVVRESGYRRRKRSATTTTISDDNRGDNLQVPELATADAGLGDDRVGEQPSSQSHHRQPRSPFIYPFILPPIFTSLGPIVPAATPKLASISGITAPTGAAAIDVPSEANLDEHEHHPPSTADVDANDEVKTTPEGLQPQSRQRRFAFVPFIIGLGSAIGTKVAATTLSVGTSTNIILSSSLGLATLIPEAIAEEHRHRRRRSTIPEEHGEDSWVGLQSIRLAMDRVYDAVTHKFPEAHLARIAWVPFFPSQTYGGPLTDPITYIDPKDGAERAIRIHTVFDLEDPALFDLKDSDTTNEETEQKQEEGSFADKSVAERLTEILADLMTIKKTLTQNMDEVVAEANRIADEVRHQAAWGESSAKGINASSLSPPPPPPPPTQHTTLDKSSKFLHWVPFQFDGKHYALMGYIGADGIERAVTIATTDSVDDDVDRENIAPHYPLVAAFAAVSSNDDGE